MCRHAAREFRCDGSTPGAARRFCVEQLRQIYGPHPQLRAVLDAAALIVSELVTNAINAGCGWSSLSVEAHRSNVVVKVCDDGPGRPSIRAAGLEDVHGRGLAIVATVAEAWGVEQTPTKCVWARLSVPAGLAAQLECAHP